MTVVVTVTVTVVGGYAIATFDFPGKNLLLLAVLGILMVPYATILIPLCILLGWIHLQDSRIGLVLVVADFAAPCPPHRRAGLAEVAT